MYVFYIQFALISFLLCNHFAATENDGIKVSTKKKAEDCTLKAKWGDEVSILYTGFFMNGKIFDTNVREGSNPLTFQLGEGNIIPGLQQGLIGMCIGEARDVTIPPHLAYGAQGRPPVIPGDSTLRFETQLLTINRPSTLLKSLYSLVTILAIPSAAIVLGYFLYLRYKNESSKSNNVRQRNAPKSHKILKKKSR